jgi:hypothetical protein
MNFEGQYLTYLEYKALGGTLDQTPFNLLEYEARKQINIRTQNRLINETTIPEDVKLCVYHLINKIENYFNTINNVSNNIASENIDGYSVSYINATQISEIIKSKNNELDDIIISDLYGVIINNEHLIYNGVKQ